MLNTQAILAELIRQVVASTDGSSPIEQAESNAAGYDEEWLRKDMGSAVAIDSRELPMTQFTDVNDYEEDGGRMMFEGRRGVENRTVLEYRDTPG